MTSQTGALIVGAGPSGMMLANVLARAGVAFRIIDKSERATEESRANIVHVRTLEMLDKLDLAEEALRIAVKIRGVDIFVKGKPAAYVPFTGPDAVSTPFPFSLGLRQGEVQKILQRALNSFGVSVEWCTELTDLKIQADGAQARLRHSDGSEEMLHAAYIVAADGAGSFVREAIDVALQGSTYEQTAFLSDVIVRDAFPPERLRLNLTTGGFVGILPLNPREKEYRLFGALSPKYAALFNAKDQGRAVPVEDLQRWFDDFFFVANKIESAKWTTIYRIHRRMAKSFRHGRVFLIGDAAHIHAPAGGQGMNLGLGDGFNLGWKLAEVLSGRAETALLDTYDEERRPITVQVINGADKGFELEATPNPILEWARIYVMPTIVQALVKTAAARRMMFKLFSQTWIDYAGSAAVGGVPPGYSGPRPGARLPFVRCEVDDASTDTFALTRGAEHVMLDLHGKGSQNEEALNSVVGASRTLIRRVAVPASEGNRSIYTLFGANDERAVAVLVRPDAHIGAVALSGNFAPIEAYVQRFFAAPQYRGP